ncbi:reverse transcriptase domain-containing protein [Moorena sp. SIO4G3]|uniref:reverse transcriptase domain-containing protein n=1 Tax=Moorena sp. SIO4G3 TaxID=2607821 RepID=UPI0014295BD3|nr:reverse transcriptase domain-containing protein [Moorena sp. SIO4G3]NEO82313.1 hypothetical protein [Moorena sp. SIO4G3]
MFKIVSFNAEGLSAAKVDLLSGLNADIICVQETHKDSVPPKIPGMHLTIHHQSPVHGSAIYARDPSTITNSLDVSHGGIEILRVETQHLCVVSVYKPPPTPFMWPQALDLTDKPHLVVGDFNSHNTLWGYSQTDNDGDAVEIWALSSDLTLLHDAKDEPSFQSARWQRGYNPDLVFASSKIAKNIEKSTSRPIPKSQHRPIIIEIKPVLRPAESKPINRFNYRKANWNQFSLDIEDEITTIRPHPDAYEKFQDLVWKAAKKNIPRGCRRSYIPCLSSRSKATYQEYVQAFNEDPFALRTFELSETLLSYMSEERKNRWQELITNIDMTHNSKKAWQTLKKLNVEKNSNIRIAAVTPNEVAHQLLLNGKPHNKERGYLKKMKESMNQVMNTSDETFLPFTIKELEEAIKTIKLGKAPGLDGVSTEMIAHFGPNTKKWLLALYNNCATSFIIPKIWRKAKVVALLKPGKDPEHPKSYRPISLLCILYKLYERLIMARISPTVDEQLSPDQAGFRPGRSCCGQVLNLTQFIEDGYENKLITGAVFVDLTAAYDTVNHRALLLKVAQTVKNTSVVRIIESLLVNRRFFVEMDGKRSRWRRQNNGLPQGSVLAPMLFNIYTNDQPQFKNIRRFIYADDLCIATQSKSFLAIERRLTKALKSLSDYYKRWFLNANPGKTQVCAFHLNNHQAQRKLKIKWDDKLLENCKYPVYLGVTLDRTLSFKEHTRKVKEKLSSRNNLLGKLANSSWGADPKTLKQTALALCYSTAEYCAPVWGRSCHAHTVDPELNKACRTITGALKPTPLPSLYRLAGIAPPTIRRNTLTKSERDKQLNDNRHPLHGYQNINRRLKSRNSFVTTSGLENRKPSADRMEQWKNANQLLPNDCIPEPNENLPPGSTFCRKDWVALNRARSGVGRTGDNLVQWKLTDDAACPCGEELQTMDHILRECTLGPSCSNQDLLEANQTAVQWIQWWHII